MVQAIAPPAPYTFDTSKIRAQREFMQSIDSELLYSSAFGAGKSRTICEKGVFLSIKYPGNFGAIFRKTRRSLRHTTERTLLREVLPPHYIEDHNKQDGIITLKNGSQIILLGVDEVSKVGSLNLGWAALDEATEFSEEDYLMILGRLRLNSVPFRQLVGACNPASTEHFLYKRFYENPEVGTRVFESNSLENPFLPQDYRDKLETYTGIYYDRYVLGKWVGLEGLVYPNFSRNRHVIEPFEIGGDWTKFRTIDFGYSNPFVCQWWAQHPPNIQNCICPAPRHNDEWYMYREIYYSERLVQEHADVINSFPEVITSSIADWDSGDRAVLDKNNIATTKANKEVANGIQTVYRMLDNEKLYFFEDALVEEDFRLKENRKPTETTGEFGNYKWQDAALNKNAKELPRMKDDHGMDAMRYLFHGLYGAASTNVGVVGTKATAPSAITGRRTYGGKRSWPRRFR